MIVHDPGFWGGEASKFNLPPDLAPIVRFNGDMPLPLGFPQNVSVQGVHFVRLSRKAHRSNMMRPRVGSNGVLPTLPDAGGQVHSCLGIRNAVPVHYELKDSSRQSGLFLF